MNIVEFAFFLWNAHENNTKTDFDSTKNLK